MRKFVAKIVLLLALSINVVADFDIYKYKPPYIVESHLKSGSNLYLVGTSHEDATKHPKCINNKVYKTIKKLLKTTKIDYLIIEGVPHLPRMIRGYIKRGLKECRSDFTKCKSEQSYAVALVLKKYKDIVVQGGEPTYGEQLNYFKSHGYKVEDLIGLWTLKKSKKGISKKRFKQKLDYVRRVFSKAKRSRVKFSFRDFRDWYKIKIGKDFSMQSPNIQIDARRYFNPYDKNDGNYIKKMNTYMLNEGIRDDSLVKKINTAVKSGYKNIAVIYGSSHVRNIYKKFYIEGKTYIKE